MVFTQNNLSKAISPYLQQHKNNPIWWQEWDKDVLEYALAENKIIFASIGYSTCHWCHVMAQESFSNEQIAEYLNAYFVSIKVDREQRLDIDQYAMAFIASLGGQGGWPLNIFFTSTLRPIYALTYAPVESRYGMPAFIEILGKIKDFYDEQKDKVKPFVFARTKPAKMKEEHLIKKLWNTFDHEYAGFGAEAKFPPHCTMLFMLYYFEVTKDSMLQEMAIRTLDKVLSGGLHDHLQGGFFRYCVGREWIIPHFEKMLYDQALLLWVYSLAYHVAKKEEYKSAAEKIIQCLEETFEHDGLYYSGHDADTDYQEGASYLWTQEEIGGILNPEELKCFREVYDISQEGNFEGKNHLVKKKNVFLYDIERKLLEARRKRHQPFVDAKIITSWNCLLGIGLIQAYRYLEDERFLGKAKEIFQRLGELNYRNDKMYHSSVDLHIQQEEFLQDCSAMLLFLTYLHEETAMYADEMDKFYSKVKDYRMDNDWIESSHGDFLKVSAETFDSPVPSSVSLAELAILRADLLSNREYAPGEFSEPLARDFFNIATLIRNGFFHLVEAPAKIAFSRLPGNTVQVKGKECKDCYFHACIPKEELCLKAERHLE